jgi:hypothetical protein
MKQLLIFFCLLAISTVVRSQTCTYPALDSNANNSYTCRGNLRINGKINDTSFVKLTSIDSSVTVTGKIDSAANVLITAQRGGVNINKKIDGGAVIKVVCRGDIIIDGKIDNGANCDFYTESGKIIIKDKVGANGTVIRYHSLYPVQFLKGSDLVPVGY